MKEFMTKLSDYLNELRNDPERKEDRLVAALIGIVAVVVIVLLLLLLWHYMGKKEESRMETAIHEEKMETYMAEPESAETDELREEYLTDITGLNDKVEELLQTLTQIQQDIDESSQLYQEGDEKLQKQIDVVNQEITNLVQKLRQTQVKIQDLTDIVQVIQKDTIPMVLRQITEIQGEIQKLHADLKTVYEKIGKLETEDAKLREEIKRLEQNMKQAVNGEITEIEQHMENIIVQIKKTQEDINNLYQISETTNNRIEKLEGSMLGYQYDRDNNVLYLSPAKE